MLLTNHTSLRGDLEVGAVFVAVTTSLLLLPPLAWLLSGGRLRRPSGPRTSVQSASSPWPWRTTRRDSTSSLSARRNSSARLIGGCTPGSA